MNNLQEFSKSGSGVIQAVYLKVPSRPNHAILCLPGRGQSSLSMMEGIAENCEFEDTMLIGFTPWNRAWYPMPRNAQDQDAAVDGLPAAVFSIQEELEEIQKEYGIPDENLAIVGFSAGSVMALQYLFESQKNLAAVFAHSGAIFRPEAVPSCKTKTPIVLFHNTNDDCFDWEERFLPMQKALIENDYNAFELIDDGGHAMYMEDLEHMELFLKEEGFMTSRVECDERMIVTSQLTE